MASSLPTAVPTILEQSNTLLQDPNQSRIGGLSYAGIDLLSSEVTTAMNQQTTERLMARRTELQQRLQAIRADLARGLAADSEEQALQLENLEVLQEINRLAEQELAEIESKLAALRAQPDDAD